MSERRGTPGAGLRRVAVHGLQKATETLWCLAFRGLHAVRGSSATPLEFGGAGSVLVVAPHPDDEVAGCGGTILRHVAGGDPVTVVYVSDGRRSTALGLPGDRMAATRRDEANRSAAALGVDDTVWLGLPEGDWTTLDGRACLAEALRAFEPTVVYAPSRIDFHPEHGAVAHVLAQALAGRGVGVEGPVVRVFQVQVPLGASLVNRYAPIETVAEAYERAVAAHASQVGSVARCRRMKRYAAAAHGIDGLAEEFWEMSAAEYVVLHREPPEHGRERYRAVRYLAVTDPAAYLIGRAARRRLITRELLPAGR